MDDAIDDAMNDTCEEEKEKLETNRDDLNIEIVYGSTNNKDGRLFGRQAVDVAYRHRILHTACVCFSMLALGLRNALIGPTFPDLRLIIDKDLSTASWIFTAKSLGGLIGAVCGGYAYDRYNRIAVFICAVSGMGIIAGVTPWCYHFTAMLLVHVLHGVFAAAVDTAATADVAVVWKQTAGPFMQAVHFAFSVGAIISPLLCEPFLAEQMVIYRNPANSSITTSADQQFVDTSDDTNYTNEQTIIVVNASSVTYRDTRIYIPYSIVSFVCLMSGCLYVVVCFIYGNVYKTSLHGDSERNKDLAKRQYCLSLKMKNLFTVLLAMCLLFYVVSEYCFIGFLMTFIISELKWSKARGSTASSFFWVALATGRLSGIVIVKYVNLSVTVTVFLSVVTLGALLFLLAVMISNNALVWVSVVVIGYGMSVIFGSVFSWLSQNIRTLTGKMTSIFFTFMFVGCMGIPILVGYLMDKISQMWFIYSCLILIGSMSACFLLTLAIFSLLKKAHDNSEAKEAVSVE